MSTKSTSQMPTWTMDVRVRERNMKSGALTEKDLEKNLAALPDLDGQYDTFTTPQPALAPPPAPPVAEASDDDLDDEDDEDENENEDEATDDVGGAAQEPAEGGES